MGSTDISSSRYSIDISSNRYNIKIWAAQISSPGETVLKDGQHRHIL
jgi:hypothetical protein